MGVTQFIFASVSTAAGLLPWAMKPLSLLIAYVWLIYQWRLAGTKSEQRTWLAMGLVSAYVIGTTISWMINGGQWSDLLYSCLIILIFPLFVGISHLPSRTQQKILDGMFVGALLYTIYHAFGYDWGRLLDPEYRGDQDYDVFVALNGAFVATYAATRLVFSVNGRAVVAALIGALVYGLLLVVVVKSRGTMAALVAVVIFMVLKIHVRGISGRGRMKVFALSSAILLGAGSAVWSEWSEIVDLFHLEGEGTRSLSTGSGRFVVWEYALDQWWAGGYWIGFGPRANFAEIHDRFLISGAHNFLIATLYDGGLLAGVPVLLLIAVPLVRPFRKLETVFGYEYYILLVVAAFNENLFFTYGSPFSWVGLSTLASLCHFHSIKTCTASKRVGAPNSSLRVSICRSGVMGHLPRRSVQKQVRLLQFGTMRSIGESDGRPAGRSSGATVLPRNGE